MAAAGTRDKAVTIQHGTTTKGASGAPVETFVDTTPPIWMAQRVKTADEDIRSSGQLSGKAIHEWKMPELPSMDPDTVDVVQARRLKYAGRVFDILSVSRSAPGELTVMTMVKTDDEA